MSRRLVFGLTLLLGVGLALPARADKSGTRPNVLSVPSGPGSVAGLGESFQVQLNSGSITEAVALQLPPGTGGLTPSLALTYDSGAGNGPVGLGWALRVSSVQRMTERGLPRYDSSDRLLLDGQELVRVAQDTWRLKNEGAFLRVRRSAEGFEVDLPSGSVRRYGLDAGSRVEGEAGAFAWYLEDEIDVWGNRVSYFYEKDGGLPYLVRVAYNRRAGAADNRVDFAYEARPDALTDYRSTFRVTTARRLKSARVFALGQQVRRYELAYRAGTDVSLLESLQMYGDDDRTALPPLRFQYSEAPTSLVGLQTLAAAPAKLPGSDADTELSDVDGDGFPDLLTAASGAHAYYRNLGAARFAERQDLPASPSVALGTSGVELADVDGDGLVDLLARTGSTSQAFRYFPNLGQGRWEPSVVLANNPSFVPEDPQTRWVDLDGDKLPDALRLTPTSATWWRNGGAGGFSQAQSLPLPPGGTALDFADGRVKLADLNGDRLLDLVFVRTGSVLWWPARGFGLFDAPESLPNAPDVGSAGEAQLQLADLTGDGLADLVRVDADHLDLWPLQPAGGFGPVRSLAGTPSTNARLTQVRLGDMNGNGTTDVVWLTPSADPDARVTYLDVTRGLRPNLLTRVENGLGLVRTLRFSTSADAYAAALAAGHPWTTRLPFSVQVLAESTLGDSRGGLSTTRYTYAQGHYDGRTREFRGFGQVEVRALGDDADPTAVEQHTYDLGLASEALKGRELARELGTEDGRLFVREVWTHAPRVYAAGLDGVDCVGVELTAHETSRFEGTQTPAVTREEWEYDGWGNPTLQRDYGLVVDGDPLGGGDELFVRRTFLNDAQGWVLGRLQEERAETPAGVRLSARRLYYDGPDFEGLPLGQLTRGQQTREERWVEADRWVSAQRVARDPYGNTVAMLTPRGARRSVEYDLATHTFPVREHVVGAEGGEGLTFQVDVVPGRGLVRSFTDANAATVRYAYDALERLVALAKPGDTLELPTFRYRYGLASPLSMRTTESRTVSGQDTVLTALSYYDGLGRALATYTQAEHGQWELSDRREYSRRGAVVREWDEALVASSGFVEAPPQTSAVLHDYDVLGREIRTIYPDGLRTETRYAPLRRELWDGEDLNPASPFHGTPLVQEQDGRGRTIAVTEDAGSARHVTRFSYDALGRTLAVVNAAGHATRYRYDGLGRLLELQHPDAGTRRFGYDDDDNLVDWQDATGQHLLKTYDGLGRLLTERHLRPDGASAGELRYHYDTPSPRTPGESAAFARGRLTWVEDLAGQEHFAYDARGHLVEDLRVVDGRDYRTRQRYDNLDRVVALTYPDDTTLDYVFNERGLLASVPGVVRSIDYNAVGLAVRREYANGVVATAEYDPHDRVRALRSTDAAGKTVQGLELQYDRAGALTQVRDSVHPDGGYSASRSFVYDALQRLERVSGPAGSASFSYDAVGNLLAKSDLGAYAYDPQAQPNAVRSVGGRPLTYDANGAVTSAFGRRFTYDVQGRLTEVATDKDLTRYAYDYEGHRTVKRVTAGGKEHTVVYVDRFSEERDGQLVKYVYSGDVRLARIGGGTPRTVTAVAAAHRAVGQGLSALSLLALVAGGALFAATGGRGRWARVLLAGGMAAALSACGGSPRGQPQPEGEPDAIYYVTDHLQSSTVLTNASGAVVSEAAYDAWGRQVVGTDEPYTFTGHEWDAEAGLYYSGARYYDPQLGRFLTPDTEVLGNPGHGVADPQVLNPYAYARNTPTSLADRDGRLPHILVGALVGATISTGIYLVKGAINGEAYTARGVLAAAASGAVTGAITAATGGASLIIQAGAEAAGSAASGVIERGIQTGSVKAAFNTEAMTQDAAAGVIGFGLGKAASAVGKKVLGAVSNRFGKAAQLAESAPGCSGGSCGLPGGGCFVAGTPVLVAGGERVPIQSVQVGDQVWVPSEDGTDPTPVAHTVTQVSHRQTGWLVDVTLENLAGETEVVAATPEHRFRQLGEWELRWTQARELRVGDQVLAAGLPLRVAAVSARAGHFDVFNLEVETAHAYVVGDTGAVVHNGAASCAKSAATASNYRDRFVKARPDLPAGFEVHHSLPQKYAETLEGAGINIHDLQFLRGVDDKTHNVITNMWNKFDKANKGNPTAAQIADFAQKIDKQFGDKFVWPGF
ncbi:hypothetical protein FGE12_06650 [Aggregicoccus sp. 17bor-14]|uniref:toxin TcdB middle/N-terminal domain-containing protein n=1 Tax=Myxococcaceae TaxID=31 RepID=UPI00129C5B6D|nr:MULTISPECIES: toxin TcdB middle/N-terminal domain-containing protein [Myxococcaceae]MBF5042068.1 VCBS repeat-containing protein [Simulacricoccus sp. 17bor-14]MRI87846.1 hypothetical protein [Aggregicoccus sp. 17bor-14]